MKSLFLLCLSAVFCGCCLTATELKAPAPPFLKQETIVAQNIEPAKLTQDGFIYGEKSLIWRNDDQHIQLLQSEKRIFGIRFYQKKTFPSWAPFRKVQNTVQPNGNTVIHTLAFGVTKEAGGKLTEKMTLLNNGKVRVDISKTFDDSILESDKLQAFQILLPAYFICDKEVSFIQEKPDKIHKKTVTKDPEAKDEWYTICNLPRVRSISVERDFSFEFPVAVSVQLRSNKQTGESWLAITFTDPSNYSYIIDLGDTRPVNREGNIVEGVNFTESNAFTVPVYQEGGNLLMNPSFESGVRYFVNTYRLDPDLMLYDKEARSGKYSLRLESNISTFTLPIFANKKYTISFYAKCLDGTSTDAKLDVRSFGHSPKYAKTYKVSGSEWQRFQYAVSYAERALTFAVSGKNLLIDDLQFEAGEKATPYKGNPYGLDILTDSEIAGVVNADDKFNAKLLLRGEAATKGKLEVEITDFFGRELKRQEFSYQLPSEGVQYFPLGNETLFPRGVNTIQVRVQPKNGVTYTDVLRLTRMKFADNTAKNKNLHGSVRYTGSWQRFSRASDKEVHLMKYCGFGGFSYFSNDVSAETFAKLEKNNMVSFGGYVMHNGRIGSKRAVFIGKTPVLKEWELYRLSTYSPELLGQIEELTYQHAAAHPHVTYWTAHTEPVGLYQPLKESNFKEYAKLVLAMNRGVMRANPQNVFNPAGCSNMGIRGQSNVIAILKACQELEPQTRFKVIDIHTYRSFPERPDTSADFVDFLAKLKDIGYPDIPVHWGEGAYFYPLIVSLWKGIAPWQQTLMKDSYAGVGFPCYDLGWGERVGGAMTMRHWLIAYRHADRLKFTCPWAPNLLDHRTPFTSSVTASVITELLGNSTFEKEIRFALDSRAYLFNDNNGNAVAAIWRFDEEFDRGMKEPSIMGMNLKEIPVEFIDMMGNQCTVPLVKGNHTIILGNFPVFVRTSYVNMAKLSEAISASIVDSGSQVALETSIKIQSEKQVEVKLINPLSQSFEGTVAIGGNFRESVKLPALGSRTLDISLSNKLKFDSFTDIEVPVTISANGKSMENNFKTNVLAVRYAVPGFDWKDIPAVPVKYLQQLQPGAKDDTFSAIFKAAWNEKNLYLRFEVKDSQFVAEHENKEPHRWYDNDSVQLFFDGLCNGRENAKSGKFGYDQDDFSYELLPKKDGSAVVFRRLVPDHQLAGGVGRGVKANSFEPDIQCTFEQKDGTLIYTVVCPAFTIEPASLATGMPLGFAFKIFNRNDSSPKVRATQALTNVPPPGDAFQKPHLYSQLIFIK